MKTHTSIAIGCIAVIFCLLGIGWYMSFKSGSSATASISNLSNLPSEGTTSVVVTNEIPTQSTTTVPTPIVPTPQPKPVLIPTPAPKPVTPPPTPKVPAPPAKPTGYTMAEVSTHRDQSSCWTAIGGSVYNLTDFISMHPGGEGRILSICGRDGTSAFEGQHGGDPRAEGALANYRLGTLQ